MAKTPSKITLPYLERAALHYLERFASSTTNLRRVMLRKIDRSVAHWGGQRDDHLAQLDDVIAKLARLGYLNDASFAQQRAASLHRQGKATRTIRATLAAKGIGAETVDSALDSLAEDSPAPDLRAAITLARKRKLGPFRPDGRDERRQKDMATLARAGFDFDMARQIVDAADTDELERWLDGLG